MLSELFTLLFDFRPPQRAWFSVLRLAPLAAAGAVPLKKQAELFFPPDFADDFPVSMQVRLQTTRHSSPLLSGPALISTYHHVGPSVPGLSGCLISRLDEGPLSG